MRTRPAEPGVYFEVAQPQRRPSSVRSDVAGFIAGTRRGPVGSLVRVEGWRQFRRMFGGLVPDVNGPYAIRGYFENGGEVAYVWRAASATVATAEAAWTISDVVAANGFGAARYRFVASSPGVWGNDLRVSIRYRLRGRLGRPEVDLVIGAPDESTETYRSVAPERLLEVINPHPDQPGSGLALVRLVAEGPAPVMASGQGPSVVEWAERELRFQSGVESAMGAPVTPGAPEYASGSQALLDEPEAAILATPDLLDHLPGPDVDDFIERMASAIDVLHDRLLLLDVPRDADGSVADPLFVSNWLLELRQRNASTTLRNVCSWYPPLGVPDPLGGAADPIRFIPASGHVAGVVSRLDRERGPHWTPANAECFDAVDVGHEWMLDEREALYRDGINLIRCVPGKGLQLWGAWTAIDPQEAGNASYLYIAHRRLIHRLVRAVRTITEPLVFESNSRDFRFSIQRAVYSVLLRFWRAGAFRGARPEESFAVVCDESNNPPAETENGRVWCEVQIARAVPMEFITLRVALGEAGRLEVFT